MAPLVKRLTLGFGSGRDVTVIFFHPLRLHPGGVSLEDGYSTEAPCGLLLSAPQCPRGSAGSPGMPRTRLVTNGTVLDFPGYLTH